MKVPSIRENLFFALLLSLSLFTGVAFSFDVDSLPVWNPQFVKQANIDDIQDTLIHEENKLETSGIKTIAVTVGDGGTEMDQELRLSMKGFVKDGIFIDALLSDVGRTAGDQSTATLREVDQVYFRVESKHFMLHLGDFTWQENTLGLFGIERSTLGIMGGAHTNNSSVSAAYGVDEVEHKSVIIQGVNGQRTGYVVDASLAYVSLVPNSEKVWLNGALLSRGSDYSINYAGGVLDFKGSIIPGLGDEIRVEYDAYNSGYASDIIAGKGSFRSTHLWLDVSGFKLGDDIDRISRGVLDSTDILALRTDDGSKFVRDDTLSELVRPKSIERAGARLRAAYNNAYIDLETAFNKSDTNTMSSKVKGPEGIAFRWNVQSDSSFDLKNFPLMLGLYGNFYEEGFNANEYMGSDRDWDSYVLEDFWDLDTLGLLHGRRHDEVMLKICLLKGLFLGSELGYRQSTEDLPWNSLRSRTYLEHFGKSSKSVFSFVYVRSEDSLSMKRYQGVLNSSITSGFIRPFMEANAAYWDIEDYSKERLRLKENAGISFVKDNFFVKEAIGAWREKTADGNSFKDSLKQISWTQSANGSFRYLNFDHLLEYKNTKTILNGKTSTWLSEENLRGGSLELGIECTLHYEFGLSKEQQYVAIYKAVATGTGDVMYDSTTGQFVEGVDNGNYVYEGMGRSDSLNAIEASTATIEAKLQIVPFKLFGIRKGILKDLTFGMEFRSEGYDTTGKEMFLPPFTPNEVRKRTSGVYYTEGDIGWNNATLCLTLHYYPGDEFEKKNTSYLYTEHSYWHRGTVLFSGRKDETWNLELLYENTDLNAVAVMDWDIYEGYLSVKRELPLGFFIEPGAKIRFGNGSESSEDFDALMRSGDFKVGYLRKEVLDTYILFSAINLKTDANYLPYKMMSGYDNGWTFRTEASFDMHLNSFFTLSSRYIVRFKNAHSGLFQKWSMEAKAYF